MTKLFKVSLLVFIFLSIIFLPPKAFAKSYSIDTVQIDARVSEDGSMNVKERRSYNFSGDYSYAYEYVYKFPDQEKSPGRTAPYLLSNFKVCETGGVKNSCYQELAETQIDLDNPKNNPTDSFFVVDQGTRYYIQWNYSAQSEMKYFEISYDVVNAVTLHSDVAELYWQFIGSEWEMPQKDILVSLSFSNSINGNDLKAWAHGPLEGEVAISESVNEPIVSFQVPRVSVGEFVEARVLMPKVNFSDGATGNGDRATIQAQEETYIKETINGKKKAAVLQKVFLVIIFGIFALIVFRFIKQVKLFLKYGKDDPLPKVNAPGTLWEPPSDIDPAQIEQLISGTKNLTPKAFTATVLSLVQDRYFKFVRSDQKQGLFTKNYKYYLEPFNPKQSYLITPVKTISSIQQSIMNFLLEKVGLEKVIAEGKERDVISLDSIVSWSQTHQMESQKFFKSLKETTLKENLSEGYFNQDSHNNKSKANGGIIIGLSILLLLISFTVAPAIFSSFGGDFSYVSIILVSGFFGFLGIVLGSIVALMGEFGEKRTPKGSEEAAEWLAFGKHMRNYKKTAKYEIDSIVIWEKYLVYGTLLGVSAKALSQLPIKFTEADAMIVSSYWGGRILSTDGSVSGLNDLSSAINSVTTVISSINQSATSSYGASGSGSSGGFSGGGSGGGGGGGGGAG